jgi:hypothetical protein
MFSKRHRISTNKLLIEKYSSGIYHLYEPELLISAARNISEISGETNDNIWSIIQTEIISHLLQSFPNSFTYTRFMTYYKFASNILAKYLNINQILKIPSEDKGAQIFLSSKYNTDINKTIFGLGSSEHGGITIYTIDYSPLNSIELSDKFFQIVNSLRTINIIKVSNELEHCRMLCYSADNDLYIAKADLNVNHMLRIFQEVASFNGLSLTLK